MTPPGTTVIIPTHNGAGFIQSTLESIFSQTLPPQEIIVVDDASTDGSAELVREAAEVSAVPIRLIRLSKNSGGPAQPVNRGVALARSPIVVLNEQDDRMLPNRLKRVCEAFQRIPRAGLVLSRYRVCRAVGFEPEHGVASDAASEFESICKSCFGGPYYLLDARDAYRAALSRCFAISLSNMAFRKSVWDALGGLDERICAIADHEMLIRAARSLQIAWVDKALWEFVRHPASLIVNADRPRTRDEYFKIWRRELRFATRPGDRWVLRHMVRQHLLGHAYQLRQQGSYASAFRSFARSIIEAGPSWSAAFGIAKLPPHFLLHLIRRKKVNFG